MNIKRDKKEYNYNVSGGNKTFDRIETKSFGFVTIQFFYSGLDSDVKFTFEQSTNGINFDVLGDISIYEILLNNIDNSATITFPLNSSYWRLVLDVQTATTGVIENINIEYSGNI